MEMKLDSDEIVVEIPGADCKNSISGNIEDVHLHHDPDSSGLRSRKKITAFTGIAEIRKTNYPITTTSQSQQLEEDTTGQLKTKSSIIEPAIPSNSETENIDKVSVTASPFEMLETPKAATTRTPLMASPGKANDDDDDDSVFYRVPTPKRPKKIKVLFIIEFSLFVCITLVLILSATMNKLKDKEIWRLELWKWCGFGLAIFCGHLFSKWLMNIVFFLAENNFLRNENVLYLLYKVHKSIRVFIWLCLILLTWVLLINRDVRRPSDTDKVVNYITRGIASTLVIAGAWVLRTILVKLLYASFYEKRFFDRIEENFFYQSVLQTLSKPPLVSGSNVVDVQKLHTIKRGVSALTMSSLIRKASQYDFFTYSTRLDKSEDVLDENINRNITSKWEAVAVGLHIFRNVARPGCEYIEEEDLLRFMIKEEVDMVLQLIGGEIETGSITKKHFINWVVSKYMYSKLLAHALNDTEEAIKSLNKFVTGPLVAVLIILWVILMGIVTTEVLLFISSQFLLAVFTFGSSAKSTFEDMIFVFVKHPFDVGDRCVIDGVQVVVEEVNILTTTFLRYDNEKIYYPNSILATKSISNFFRSPDMMDTVEFDLDVSTSVENISALKAKIEAYIHSKPHLWQPQYSVRVREIEDGKKMKMRLYVTHTINFQDYEEKSDRRSNLVLELRNIFHELGIKYHILPPTSSD